MRSSVSATDLDTLRAAIGGGVVLPYALALAPPPLRALPARAVDALIAAAGPGSGTGLVSAELRHLGGGEFAVVGIGVTGNAEQAERVRVGLEQLARRLARWAPPTSGKDAGGR